MDGLSAQQLSRSQGTGRAEVLTSVYVMFNETYLSAGPSATERAERASDAEWLASLLMHPLPDDPEMIGLLALIRLHQARRLARFDAAGDLVLLKDQDRSLWDRAAIDDALALLDGALRMDSPATTRCRRRSRPATPRLGVGRTPTGT